MAVSSPSRSVLTPQHPTNESDECKTPGPTWLLPCLCSAVAVLTGGVRDCWHQGRPQIPGALKRGYPEVEDSVRRPLRLAPLIFVRLTPGGVLRRILGDARDLATTGTAPEPELDPDFDGL